MRRGASLLLGPLVILFALPFTAAGQPRRSLPTVGILCAVWCEALDLSVPVDRLPTGRAFVDALRERGHIDGETMVLDQRGVAVKSGLAGAAADLVRRRVDLILADGLAAAQAATKATDRTPVLLVGVPDAVSHGLVQSLARPAGNVTGLTVPFALLVGKQLELLREAVPRASRVGVLSNPGNPEHGPTVRAAVQDASRTLGVDVWPLEARSRAHDELETIFATVRREGLKGLLVLSDPTLYGAELHSFALKNRVPMIAMKRAFAQGGGLMSYGPHPLDTARRAAYFVDRLLRGARPADLPVEEPTRYELIVNLTTAKALGLTIPPSVLIRADEIIQ